MKVRVTIDTETEKNVPKVEILKSSSDLGDYSRVGYTLAQAGVLFITQTLVDNDIAVPTKMLKNRFNGIINTMLGGD